MTWSTTLSKWVLQLCLVSSWLWPIASSAQTTLQPGQLVITGVNSTSSPTTGLDEFSFAPLVDLAPGTQIQFTDNGWQSSGSFRLNEGIATYTAPTLIPKGTLISFGRAQSNFNISGPFDLSVDGDQLLVYQGSISNPQFIYALTTKTLWTNATSSNNSALPPGVVLGSSAIALGKVNAFMSQVRFRHGTASALATWFSTLANWTVSDKNTLQNWLISPPYDQDLRIETNTTPNVPSTNTERNWTIERTYDGNNNVIAESKQFVDGLGRSTQAQARNAATQQVFASQTIYNAGGQAVLQTLAAPTNNQSFNYKEDFVTASGVPYGYAHFEGNRPNGPEPVDATTPGTLGYYFSKQNSQEPLTPATSYPYSLVEPYEGPLGGTKRAASPGDELRMGKGREAKGRDFPLRKEFDAYLTLRPQFVPGSSANTLEYQGQKTVSINADGRESIIVTNKEGQAIISCLSGSQYPALLVAGSISADAQSQPNNTIPAYQDSHIPSAGPQEVTFTMSSSYQQGGRVLIINLVTGDTTSYPIKPSQAGNAPERRVTLNPGFYRFVSVTGTQWSSYEAHYGNFSYTYYDDAGRAISTVAPNGLPGGSNYVRNPSFDQEQMGTQNPSAWQTTTNPPGASYTENFAPAHSGEYYCGQWQPSGSWNAYTYQVITGLPNGRYTLHAWVESTGGQTVAEMRARNYGGPNIQVAFPSMASWMSWQQLTLSNIQVTNGQCEIGFYSESTQSTWIRFDDVELVQEATNSAPAFVTRNTYDSSSRLLATESDDEGRSEYVYATDGRIRFSQSALQRSAGRFSYSNYDEVGRVVESGEYTPGNLTFENHLTVSPAANSVLQTSVLEDRSRTGGLSLTNCAQRNQVWYDLPWDGTALRPDGTTDPNHQDSQLTSLNRKQQFVVGAVSKTKNDNVTTWYSYDELGRVMWVVQDITGVGVKTLDYKYDFSGNVLEVAYQKDQADRFYHYYDYDEANRLAVVYTSPDGTTRTVQAEYSYYLHGPLKRVQVAGNLQGVDYTYTIEGALKSINHVNSTLEPGHDSPTANKVYKDLFALTLDYYSGDYRSQAIDIATPTTAGQAVPTRYDGTIQGAAWRTAASADIHRVAYTYDEKSQLQNAQYGKQTLTGTASTFTPTGALREGGLTYDANGNMQSIQRTNQQGATTDNFSYKYKPNTNQLAEVHSGGLNGTTTLDYDYDALGQMTRQRDEQGQRYFTYDVTGKTTGVYFDVAHQQPLVTFTYDDRGFRVTKTSWPQSAGATQHTTYYVRDIAGNVLATYEKATPTSSVQRTEVPVYGAGRLGTLTHLDNGSDDYRYELTDHLGDARVVFHRPTTTTGTETMELSGVPAQVAFQGANLYRYYTQNGHNLSDYVALMDGRTTPSPTLKRVVSVQKGDTITFSAWARVTGGFSSPYRTANTSGVKPFLMFGAAATSDEPLARETDGRPVRAQAGPGRWLSRLAVGLRIPLQGKQQAPSAARSTPPLPTFNAWIKYRVLDANDNPVGDEETIYLIDDAHTNWKPLQLGIRIQRGSKIELTATSAETSTYVEFDDLEVKQEGGLIVQEQHQYAYGAPLPGLSYTVGNRRYRYGYQGQYAEHDTLTGFESFELRLYNSRIGRWMSYDPEGQFSSPYLGMGNNPVSGVDPNGGQVSPLAAMAIGAGVGAIAGGFYSKANGGDFGSGAVAGAAVGALAGGFAWAALKDVNFSAIGDKLHNIVGYGAGSTIHFDAGTIKVEFLYAENLWRAKGLHIALGYDGPASSTQWFQTVTFVQHPQNEVAVGIVEGVMYMDPYDFDVIDRITGPKLPAELSDIFNPMPRPNRFFYRTNEADQAYRHRATDAGGVHDYLFIDWPHIEVGPGQGEALKDPRFYRTWLGELSLVQVVTPGNPGVYQPLITMTYGYKYSSSGVRLTRIRVHRASPEHLHKLQKYRL